MQRPPWDPNKERSNRARHGVGFDEAQEAILDRLSRGWPDAEHSFGDPRIIVIGESISGRLLFVVVTADAEGKMCQGRPRAAIGFRLMAEREHSRYYSTRPRRVPPEFCSDELLEECSILATLLLYRIVSQADNQGRLRGHPRYIKAVCFVMRPDVSERKVAAAIDELVRAGFLIRYDARQRVYLQVDRWQGGSLTVGRLRTQRPPFS